MNKYAIIQLQGKQYQVSEGDKFIVDQLDTEEGKNLKITDVLLMNDGKDCQIGTPLVKDAVVEIKIVHHQKGKKIRVAKYKAKSRYRKVKGHRQAETVVEVAKIS